MRKPALLFLVVILLLSACGEAEPTRPPFKPPTAPPTPVSFDSVAPAATIDPGSRSTVPVGFTGQTDTPFNNPTPLPEESDNRSGFINADSTVLAQILGTPGPNSRSQVSGSGRPGGINPTPTLGTGGQTIASLRSSRVSFLFAYRQVLVRVQAIQRQATLVFASAQNLRSDRTTWAFLFSWPEGRKTWRVIFDARADQSQPDIQLTEVATTMLPEAGQIDMTRVLDGDELVSRAESNGLKINIPVDIINFQVDGQSRLPSFVLTNVPQGKQVVLNAYSGQIIRNDFKE